ncbi:MAG: tetratricopeptide repeat protein [Isosphaeraceae bacterium]
MNRTLTKLALGSLMVLLSLPTAVVAGRGGGYRGGGGGGGYGGGNHGGGEMGGGSMGHSPSFSQARRPSSQSGSYGNRSQYGSQGSSNHNAGAATAGAGYANNQDSSNHNAGAAAAGAGYANRNQGSAYPNAGAAAAGAGYANNHNGTWNGNNYAGWGATGLGTGYASGVGAWGTGSPMYGWGYSGYSNPYSGGLSGSGGVPQNAGVPQTGASQQTTATAGSDYSQPISTTAPTPEPAVAAQAGSAYDQARESFKAGDYAQALQLDQQALAQTPNDTTMQEFLALVYFAQGQYQQAAAPLYAVLSVKPGWDWTTLSGMYAEVDTYTRQLRALEASVKASPDSAQAHFLLAYHYLTQGHDPEAIAQLKDVVRLQPGDTVSAQIIAAFQPSGGSPPPPAESAPGAVPAVEGRLAGTWAATPAQDAKIALTIQDDGTFSWTATGPGKPPMNITGKSTLAGGILTLAAQGGQTGALVGQVAWKDADDFSFRLVGGPSNDPGLKFAR